MSIPLFYIVISEDNLHRLSEVFLLSEKGMKR